MADEIFPVEDVTSPQSKKRVEKLYEEMLAIHSAPSPFSGQIISAQHQGIVLDILHHTGVYAAIEKNWKRDAKEHKERSEEDEAVRKKLRSRPKTQIKSLIVHTKIDLL